MHLTGEISLRIFISALLALGAMGTAGCGGGGPPDYIPLHEDICDLDSLRNEQKDTGYKRDNYYPERFSRDLNFRNYGADISPTEKHEHIARKVSRSVFDMEFRKDSRLLGMGTGWLIAPRYVVTSAHSFRGGEQVFIHTFEGNRVKAEKVVYIDPGRTAGTDLALLRLEEEIDAVPMKIADRRPLRNEFLMAMGGGGRQRGLGGWTVSAGPALELKSGYPISRPDRMYHAAPVSRGMSGGPVFNDKGEVVSIVSTGRLNGDTIRNGFGVMPSEIFNSPPERLWIYAFHQSDPHYFSLGPNIDELKELYEKWIPNDERPRNAGDYRNDNIWPTGHEFGDNYSPFPIDQFELMQDVYKEAREATVIVRTAGGSRGSGFIYDDNTVVTVGHVATRKGDKVDISTIDSEGRRSDYTGKVSKTHENRGRKCDIAVIKMDEQDAFSEYPKLGIADSSSLNCGDPLVAIGSGAAYRSVGPLQGIGIVYRQTETYRSEFFDDLTVGGMSGGPIVDINRKVVSLVSEDLGRLPEEGESIEPGPLVIRTRFPVYAEKVVSRGPNAEIIRRFVEEDDYYCPE